MPSQKINALEIVCAIENLFKEGVPTISFLDLSKEKAMEYYSAISRTGHTSVFYGPNKIYSISKNEEKFCLMVFKEEFSRT